MMTPAPSPAQTLRRRVGTALLLGLATTILTAWALVFLAQLPRPANARNPTSISELRYEHGTNPHTSPAGDQYDVGAAVWRRPGGLYMQTSISQRRIRDAIREFLPDRQWPAADTLIPPWAQREMFPWLHGRTIYPTGFTGSDSRTIMARGWPCLALYCTFTDANFRSTPPYHDTLIGGGIRVPIPTRATAPYTEPAPPNALPLTPIWRGLAANTALYASLWAVILFVPGGIRRTRRRRRGLCPICAYDVKHCFGIPCPECGACILPRTPNTA